MAGLEHEDEWNSEEFQTALKIVLKYEIQSLLDRLSYHGEETVLFTASMEDNAVGHLASTNALRFADGKEVGELKNKFLSFVTGSVQQQPASKQMMQHGTARNVNVKSGDPLQRSGPFHGQLGIKRSSTGPRASERETGSLSDSDVVPRHPDIAKVTPGQQGKLGAKRQLEDISVPKDKFMSQPLSPKRRKTDNAVVPSQQQLVLGARPKQPLIAANKIGQGAKGTESFSQFPVPRLSSGQQIQQQQKTDIKLNTTKVVSKSGFVEERLSQAEFEKILQQYKHTDKAEMREGEHDDEEEEDYGDEDEEDDDDDYKEILEEGEIRFPYMEQQTHHTSFQQKRTLANASGIVSPSTLPSLKQQPAGMASVSKSSAAVVNVSSATSMTKSASGKTSENEASKKIQQQMPVSKSNSVMLATNSNKTGVSTPVKKLGDDSKSSEKESDGNVKDVKKGSEQSQGKGSKELISEQRGKDEGEKDKSGNTQKKDGQQKKRFDNVDDMDTEDLIKMVKARHAESQSDADKQIQAKLGQLSSKLSWVVEYPKDGPDGQQQPQNQQQQQQRQLAQMQGMGAAQMANMMYPDMEDFLDEDDEEDYDDDDFDEEDLDEEDRAALANMRKLAAERLMAPQKVSGVGVGGQGQGLGQGQFDGEIGDDEEYADYDEVMEGFDEHHRVFNPGAGQMPVPGEQLGMPDYAVEPGNQVSGYTGYQRPASPSLDNYLLMGPMMAKCLVCNKIIRKTEIKQHNKQHDEEYQDEEGEEEEGDEQAGVYDGQAGDYGSQGGEFDSQGGEFDSHRGEFVGSGEEGEEMHEMDAEYDEHGQDYHEEGEVAEEGVDPEDLAEFTAEPLVAEKIVTEKISPTDSTKGKKAEKSTVCEVCDKKFCSNGNLRRHMQSAHNIPKKPDFKCPICEKIFKQSGGLSRHIKKLHPDFDMSTTQGSTGEGGAVTGSGSDGDGVTGAPDGGAEDPKENEITTSQTNT